MKRLTTEERDAIASHPRPIRTEAGWMFPDEPARVWANRSDAITARADRLAARFNCRAGYARHRMIRARLAVTVAGYQTEAARAAKPVGVWS